MTRNGKYKLNSNPFRRLFWLIILQFSFLVLLTCTSSNRLPGYVHYRIGNSPTTLDPALIVDVNGGTIAAKLFNGLVRLGEDLRVQPDVAERWTVSGDGLTYRFFLRKGVAFSSGREVHAWDFKYSFERVLDPETKSSHTWIFDNIAGAEDFMSGKADSVNGIRIINDYTLEIKLKRTFSPFLGLLTMPAAYVVPMEEVLHHGLDFSSHPIGTGPYVLEEWLPNRHLRLKARSDYFEGFPLVKGIMYRIIPEELTAVAEYELGNLDVISIPQSEYARYRNSKKWRGLISSIEGINTYYLGLNCRKPPFDNPGLRQAVSHAIDRQRILSTLYEGRARLASGPVADILRSWSAPEVYEYDVKKSRGLIEELNPIPKEVEFYITAEQQVVDIAEVIQSYLEKVGLKVSIRQLEWSAFKEAISKGEANMFWLSWWADYPDPENFLFPTFHSSNHGAGGNRAMYSNKEVDTLIEAGRHAVSESLRNEYYEKAEKIIIEEAPWVFFWHRTDYTLRQPWVKRYKVYPVYSMDKGLDIAI
jgi:peptide/nickel transport system substrate-binding protein/oligopeptide transport system substrate-binding protein